MNSSRQQTTGPQTLRIERDPHLSCDLATKRFSKKDQINKRNRPYVISTRRDYSNTQKSKNKLSLTMAVAPKTLKEINNSQPKSTKFEKRYYHLQSQMLSKQLAKKLCKFERKESSSFSRNLNFSVSRRFKNSLIESIRTRKESHLNNKAVLEYGNQEIIRE